MPVKPKSKGKRSGGPRSAAGKARTCRNALKHGLASCYKHDALLLQQTQRIARALCGEDMSELLFEQASVVAKCEQHYRRVVAYRLVIIERLQDLFDRNELEAMQEAHRNLERLRYYERRAWSRRIRAIRQFIVIKALPDLPEGGPKEPCACKEKN